MIEKDTLLRKKKKERIRINDINSFKCALEREGYKIDESNEEEFKEKVAKIFEVDNSVTDRLYRCISNTEITYKADDVRDFIDYIEKIMLFEDEHNKLCKKISGVKRLNIDRIEYEREPTIQDNVEDIIKDIEKIKGNVSRMIDEREKEKLVRIENELDKEYLYAKDIELLKKMLLIKKEVTQEKYNSMTRTKTISIEIIGDINCSYIKAKKGTVEYHDHLTTNIPRIRRLRRNINKYMTVHKNEKTTFNIDQSETLQDSINIAVAVYDNKEFKAISGSNDISDYCIAPSEDDAFFKSSKVNKLGKLGIGYNRVNDSEKKIFEEIHKQIEAKELNNEGNLILYSKWEPCPSCCFVISQFCKKHPNIDVQIKYIKKYGE
ncbi:MULTISPECIES: deaminase domain-containing protein [Clostridium]|uniref:APOBEC-like N-terminal domain-containing protein n=1 Tax=Clostridium cibarium TaxID=2762247 RepID=A0ABR8PSL3_9CLOT|nr:MULTISPECIES: deaminase domain-containing protein [Clostridium]MBD7911165.1 hypothetical protein [Clostridium cibarium]